MTLDKFGRHLTHKRLNKIYLIEDAKKFRRELRQHWMEEFEKFKEIVSSHMNGLPAIIASNFKQDMRCPVLYVFWGNEGKDKDYYIIKDTQHSFIELYLDCKIAHVKCEWIDLEVDLERPGEPRQRMNIKDLKDQVLTRGSRIFVRRLHAPGSVWGAFICEVAPWHKDESPFK